MEGNVIALRGGPLLALLALLALLHMRAARLWACRQGRRPQPKAL